MIWRTTVFLVAGDPHDSRAIEEIIAALEIGVRSFIHPHDFLTNYDPTTPGCLVFGYALNGMSGVDLHQYLGQRGGLHPALILAADADVTHAVQAMKQGAFDYIQLPLSRDRLCASIRSAIETDSRFRQQCLHKQDLEARLRSLTPRENEVLDRVVDGRLTKQIARELQISPRTVEAHRAHAVRKLGANSVAQLVRLMLEHRATALHPRDCS